MKAKSIPKASSDIGANSIDIAFSTPFAQSDDVNSVGFTGAVITGNTVGNTSKTIIQKLPISFCFPEQLYDLLNEINTKIA